MLCNVVNRAKSARGFATLDRGIVMLEAGAHALLDLADHALHRAWVASGAASIAPLAEKDAKAVRKRIEAEAEAAAQTTAAALAGLPVASVH